MQSKIPRYPEFSTQDLLSPPLVCNQKSQATQHKPLQVLLTGNRSVQHSVPGLQ
jgi:hypothetical protein